MKNNQFRCSACNKVRSATNGRWRQLRFSDQLATCMVCRACAGQYPAPTRYTKVVAFRVTPTELGLLEEIAGRNHGGVVADLIRSKLFD